jgi:hypothetical protein
LNPQPNDDIRVTFYRNPILRRYLVACVTASLVTIAILFVMTQLVAPTGGDPVVRQMLMQLEFQRRPLPDTASGVRIFELPPKPKTRRAADSPPDAKDLPQRPDRGEYDDEDVAATPGHVIDWWAQARAVIQDLGDAEFEEWLESQGNQKWVSVMQGPMPISGEPTTPSEQATVGTAYRNVYGDLEVRVSENCVIQIQSRLFDTSDFAKNIPPRIVCKGTSGMDLSGLHEFLHKGREQ